MTARGLGAESAGFPRPFGKYTLLSHLAVGGMADVFLAQHKGPAGFEKECVIKRILPHLGMDQDFVQMFLDEGRIAARLSHPNIVQIFDLGQVGQDYFLAMEYVDGIDLEHLSQRAAKLESQGAAIPWTVAVRVVADVAAGLDHAHNVRDSGGRPLHLVHRDVSPSNIMVSWGGAAKILDFGIAKAVSSSLKRSRTEVGTVKGKIPYMSPEQLQGLHLDGRSDVFSLGVILYETLCGSRPFPAETAAQLTMQILHDEPQAPELLNEEFPLGLKPIVLKALAKRREDRWQTARDFQLALEGFLADQQTSCTAYDVEAYLRKVYPEGTRPHHVRVVTGTGQTEVGPSGVAALAPPAEADGEARGRESAASRRSATPRADKEGNMRADKRDQLSSVTDLHKGPQGRLSDLARAGVDDDEVDERRPRRGGGGLLVVIALLVVATGVALFLLRGYVVKQEQAQQAAADLATPPAPKVDAGAAAAQGQQKAADDKAAQEALAAREKAARELKEKEEREAKERALKEAKEKALKEARERAAREKAAREKAAEPAELPRLPPTLPPDTE